ncbi:VOC family protein, partial [uncultured Methylibium sp.]|uniref:VOC family protein n=1 Tax=uncultured Methylibium sp. TaxID=381093 RepID=UPI0025D267B7
MNTGTAARLDHLVIGADTLAQGVAWCEAELGITPGPGGRHALMSTHNRVFTIASDGYTRAYAEIIAIDPDAPPPGRARWFGL